MPSKEVWRIPAGHILGRSNRADFREIGEDELPRIPNRRNSPPSSVRSSCNFTRVEASWEKPHGDDLHVGLDSPKEDNRERVRGNPVFSRHTGSSPSKEVHWDKPESAHSKQNWESLLLKKSSDFDTKGHLDTDTLAGRLCDELEKEEITVRMILCSKHTVAKQTALVFAEVLKTRAESNHIPSEGELCCCLSDELTPDTEEYGSAQFVDAQLSMLEETLGAQQKVLTFCGKCFILCACT
jgi:hypothetical protein